MAETTSHSPNDRVTAIAEAAARLPRSEQPAFVACECARDIALRRAVEERLAGLRVEQLFDAASSMTRSERVRFLVVECGSDLELLSAVMQLLEANDALPTLDPPAVAGGAFHSSEEDIPAIPPGTRIRQYTILGKLGGGGMGQVYLARHTGLERLVAVKFLPRPTEKLTDLFLAEARAVARCEHENIVRVHDVDLFETMPYMVLEYIDGKSLLGFFRKSCG